MVDGGHIGVVRAGFEDFIVFIIIAAGIIGQILKARAKAKGGPDSGPTSPSRPGSGSPEDELREFLQSLTGEVPPPKPPPPAAPPRLPPPVPAAPPIRTRTPAPRRVTPPQPAPVRPTPARPAPVRPAAPRVQVTLPRPAAPAAAPPPVPPKRRKPMAEPAPAMEAYRSPRSKARAHLRATLGADLIDKDSLRKAIVLREILDRPVGARP